jgi:hypothetical protein
MAGGGGLSGLVSGKSGSNQGAINASAAASRQAADKQAARNAINAAFGIAPSADNIDPNNFQYASKNNDVSLNTNNGHIFNGGFLGGSQNFMDFGGALFGGGTKYHSTTDQAAYAAAKAEYDKEVADAAANKTARDALYDKVRSDAFGAGKTSLDDNKTTAARQNKFALFAQGLNGGSQDVDESALLDRTYNHGLLDLGARADAARSGLQSADEASRLGLLTSVDNGMSTSDALTSALSQMKTGADQAEAAAKGTSLGDLFANAGLLYSKSNAARGAQAGMNYWQNLYPQAAQLSGGKGGGIVTSTGG